jgi:Co/Zn/Cd efflux system component
MAIKLAHKQCGDDLPYGLYRLEVLAALLNGLGLAGFSLWIICQLLHLNRFAKAARL